MDNAIEVENDVAMQVIYSFVWKFTTTFFIFFNMSKTISLQLS